MIRAILTEVALFVTPFVLYALFLAATRAGVLDPQSWPPKVLAILTAVALLLLLASFLWLAQYKGAPAGSDYVPPHMEDGKLVPGQIRKK
jgi:heme/copper-type cytochrome/quinol oxidase subunit 3